MEEKIRVSFSGMDTSDALEKYALEKFTKHQFLLELVTSMDISMTQNVTHRGVSNDFELEAIAKVPKTVVKVNERGEDMYALIDLLSDKLFRGLKRYYDKLGQWEGKAPWKTEDSSGYREVATDGEFLDYREYVPNVTDRREIQYRSPMEEAEAIERMELLGRQHLLFKNIKNNRISLVFKNDDGYSIEEVPEGV